MERDTGWTDVKVWISKFPYIQRDQVVNFQITNQNEMLADIHEAH